MWILFVYLELEGNDKGQREKSLGFRVWGSRLRI